MRQLLKIVGFLLGVVIVLVVGLAVFVQIRGMPSYPVEKVELRVERTPARIARGKQIALNLCVLCHQDPATQRLTGKRMTDVPDAFGIVYSRNITQHPTQGIGAWTDGELAWLMRTGIHPKTGSYVPPWMIKLPLISDEDLLSIIAFLRSDDPLVAAADVPDRDSRPGFLAKFLASFVFKPYAYPKEPMLAPAKSDQVAYGRYLADAVYACYGCHSADFKTNNEQQPEKSVGYYAGGNQLKDVNGKVIYTSNLTPDVVTGIGKWSEADFKRALHDGFRPDGTLLHAPMERYNTLPDEELGALFAYLRTVPAVHRTHAANASYDKLAQSGSAGKQLYYSYGCQYCHGTTGVGTADLRNATTKFPGDDARIASWIKDAAVYKPDSRMPRFDGVIAEADYAPLVAYVRELGASSTTDAAATR